MATTETPSVAIRLCRWIESADGGSVNLDSILAMARGRPTVSHVPFYPWYRGSSQVSVSATHPGCDEQNGRVASEAERTRGYASLVLTCHLR